MNKYLPNGKLFVCPEGADPEVSYRFQCARLKMADGVQNTSRNKAKPQSRPSKRVMNGVSSVLAQDRARYNAMAEQVKRVKRVNSADSESLSFDTTRAIEAEWQRRHPDFDNGVQWANMKNGCVVLCDG
jgi:hypothetical protein